MLWFQGAITKPLNIIVAAFFQSYKSHLEVHQTKDLSTINQIYLDLTFSLATFVNAISAHYDL